MNVLFDFLTAKLKMSDAIRFKPEHFQLVIELAPDLILSYSIKILKLMVPFIQDIWRNDLLLLIDGLVKMCAITSEKVFQEAVLAYEEIINANIEIYPKVTSLRSYHRELIQTYYMHNTTYETDERASELIALL